MADFTALKSAIQTYIKQNGNEEITGEKLQEILLSVVTTLGDSAINDLVTALANEVAARQNADGTLQQNITNEATARGNADTALGGRIDDEATARANGDTALSERLGSSITAENTAADQIGAEAEARAAADIALHDLIDGITDNIENGYVYAGIATPSSTPATGKVFYLALTAGTYTNFGSTVVSQGINILKYNGSAWSLDAFIGIDDELTPSSNKLPKSGNVLENIIKNGSAFDLSAYNAVDGVLATYADLDAALAALSLLPAVYKQPGMSFRFVLTSDNKYKQFRLMATSFSTTESDWQGVDNEPIDGSDNLIKSGGVKNDIFYINDYRSKDDMIWGTGHPRGDGYWSYVGQSLAIVLRIKQGDTIDIRANSSQPTILSVLKSYNPQNDAVIDYATGETGRRVISGNAEATINITSADANFLHILYSNEAVGITYAPAKLVVNGYDYGKSVHEYIIASKFVTGTSEQLIDNVPSTDFSRAGFYLMDSLGTFRSNDGYATTELIEVGLGQHVRLHTVCPTTIAAVILYDENQSLITAMAGLTDAIEYRDIELDIDDYPSAHYITFTSRSGYSNKADIVKSAKTTDELLRLLLEGNSNIHYIFDALDAKQDKYPVLAVYNYYKGLYKGKYGNGLVSATGAASYVDAPEAKHIVFPIKAGDVVNVKAGTDPCLISILSTYKEPTLNGQLFFFATGESRRTIPNGSQSTINVTASDAKYMVVNISYIDISYIPAELTVNGYDLTSSIEEKLNTGDIKPSASAKNFMGHADVKVNPKKYVFVPCYGQSLSDGSDSLYVTDPVVDGCYMLGNIVATQTSLVPLQLTSGHQHPIVSCVNSLATLMHKYYDDKCKFIAASVGTGGRSIAQLSKASRIAQYAQDYDYSIKDAGRYEDYFLASLDNAITAVGAGNVECPAIIYLQGERDYVTDSQAPDAQPGSVDAAYACGGDKDLYKSRMMDLKNDMQADIMAKFGQSYKPIFCIYEVSGPFIRNDKMTINMAQIEFAQENDDVYLMPSPYFVPDYGAHLSTNGYRWYGEFLAKALFGILCQDSYWKPILPYQYKVDDSKIIISLENNVGKLQFDATLVEQSTNNGFAVYINDSYSASNISSVEIDDNHIVITCNQSLTGKKVEVVYGGNKTSGSGNVRDNDVYRAMYTYWDDSNDHGSDGTKTIVYRPDIIGDKYPMYNWLASFYQLVNNPT